MPSQNNYKMPRHIIFDNNEEHVDSNQPKTMVINLDTSFSNEFLRPFKRPSQDQKGDSRSSYLFIDSLSNITSKESVGSDYTSRTTLSEDFWKTQRNMVSQSDLESQSRKEFSQNKMHQKKLLQNGSEIVKSTPKKNGAISWTKISDTLNVQKELSPKLPSETETTGSQKNHLLSKKDKKRSTKDLDTPSPTETESDSGNFWLTQKDPVSLNPSAARSVDFGKENPQTLINTPRKNKKISDDLENNSQTETESDSANIWITQKFPVSAELSAPYSVDIETEKPPTLTKTSPRKNHKKKRDSLENGIQTETESESNLLTERDIVFINEQPITTHSVEPSGSGKKTVMPVSVHSGSLKSIRKKSDELSQNTNMSQTESESTQQKMKHKSNWLVSPAKTMLSSSIIKNRGKRSGEIEIASKAMVQKSSNDIVEERLEIGIGNASNDIINKKRKKKSKKKRKESEMETESIPMVENCTHDIVEKGLENTDTEITINKKLKKKNKNKRKESEKETESNAMVENYSNDIVEKRLEEVGIENAATEVTRKKKRKESESNSMTDNSSNDFVEKRLEVGIENAATEITKKKKRKRNKESRIETLDSQTETGEENASPTKKKKKKRKHLESQTEIDENFILNTNEVKKSDVTTSLETKDIELNSDEDFRPKKKKKAVIDDQQDHVSKPSKKHRDKSIASSSVENDPIDADDLLEDCISKLNEGLYDEDLLTIDNEPIDFNTAYPEKEHLDFNPPLLHKCMKSSLKLVNAETEAKLKTLGIHINKGRFNSEEDQQILKNFQKYAEDYQLKNPIVLLGINMGGKVNHQKFVQNTNLHVRLAYRLDNRTLNAVNGRAKKILSPYRSDFKKKMTEDEIKKFKALRHKFGNKYHQMSKIMERDGKFLCAFARYNSLEDTTGHKGKWSEEETKKLLKAVKKVLKTDDLTDIYTAPWDTVATYVTNRNAFQCRFHFLNNCVWEINKKSDNKEKWTSLDDGSLIERLFTLCFNEGCNFESEVDWEALVPEFKNVASGLQLRRHWFIIKYKVPNHSQKSFEEILTFLSDKIRLLGL